MSTTENEEPRPTIPEPEITDEHRRQAAEMAASYETGRPTAILPGTDGMVSGTAVNDWIDENGDPIYGRAESDGDQD
ncbi:hypothetical protein [Nocardia acidivorans]|uniref:hypothetical protein n=1 Tax=Nocardia acidivorans TaxID=404580 RepID=UPI00083378F1|nr:hypothetical protein [Nocardia acidivorans]